MGVHHLWNILEQCKRTESIDQLMGKTLCIDLSLWICEAQGTKGLKDQLKPYLRNVFFRTMYLVSIGVRPVFVIDGIPPEIKRDTILKRLQARPDCRGKRNTSGKTNPKKLLKRSKFNIWCDECCEMFRLLGIPFVKSEGEAEATCAWLNNNKFADGVLTDDGDVFLYGAKVVYKDFNISSSKSLTDCLQVYYLEDIESNLGLNQRNMIALGLLLGCDYLPTGVPGIGKETVVKLLSSLAGVDLLHRFQEWKESPDVHPNDYTTLELNVKRKAVKVPNFPEKAVISEFLSPKVGKAKVDITWKCPDIEGIKGFFLRKLDWPTEYTEEKMFTLGTDWQLASPDVTLFVPIRIVKERTRQKVKCFEIEWQTQDTKWPSNFTCIKTKEVMRVKHSMIIESFESEIAAKKSKSKGKSRKDSKTKSASCSDQPDELQGLLSKIENIHLEEKPIITSSVENCDTITHITDKHNITHIIMDKPNIKPRATITHIIDKHNIKPRATITHIIDTPKTTKPSGRFPESKKTGLARLDDSTASGLEYFEINESINDINSDINQNATSFTEGVQKEDNPPIDAYENNTFMKTDTRRILNDSTLQSFTSPSVSTHVTLHDLSRSLFSPNSNETVIDNLVDITIDQSFGSDIPNIDEFLTSSFIARLNDHEDPFSPVVPSRFSTPYELSSSNEERSLVDSFGEVCLKSNVEPSRQDIMMEQSNYSDKKRSGRVAAEMEISQICTPQEEASLTSRLLKRFQLKKNGGIVNTLRLISSGDDHCGIKVEKISNDVIDKQSDKNLRPLYDITNQKKLVDYIVLD